VVQLFQNYPLLQINALNGKVPKKVICEEPKATSAESVRSNAKKKKNWRYRKVRTRRFRLSARRQQWQ
jgi:hypothetical protein